MRNATLSIAVVLSTALGSGLAACGSTEHPPGAGAGTSGGAGVSGAGTSAAGLGGSALAGSAGSGGSSGGTSGGAGGAGGTPTGGQGNASGAAGTGKGGSSAQGGASAGSSGTSSTGGAPTSGCTGAWDTADPALPGSFETVTETNVGPAVGEGADGGAPVAFTLFRPKELGECHPVVTWGNGTGSNPGLYKVLLGHLASHGFVVIASDSPQVAQGDPPPMVAGVTWVLEQNADPASALYQHIDTAHVGATGHSQGGFATTTAGGDEHVTTIAPLCGASSQRNLHGPALLFCGGADATVPCSTVERSYDTIESQPVMLAEYISGDHANWITFRGTTPSPVEIAVTAWMRVHLMGDTALRSWFYGPSCKLCTDAGWQISQKRMDE